MAAVLSDELKRSATRRWIIDDLFDCFPINGWNGGKKKKLKWPKVETNSWNVGLWLEHCHRLWWLCNDSIEIEEIHWGFLRFQCNAIVKRITLACY